MSSPAAELGLAYSPWCAGNGVTEMDRHSVARLFQAVGLTDEVDDEEQIDAGGAADRQEGQKRKTDHRSNFRECHGGRVPHLSGEHPGESL